MVDSEGRVADSGVVEITRGHRQSGGHRSLEDVAVLRHLEVSGIRGNNERPARGIVLVDVDEAIGLGERLLAEQDRVHDAEDGGICAMASPRISTAAVVNPRSRSMRRRP